MLVNRDQNQLLAQCRKHLYPKHHCVNDSNVKHQCVQ